MIPTPQPYPHYKPSHVDWLGDVPAHWDVRQLGRIGRLSKGTGGTKEDEVPEGIPCIRYGDLYTSHNYHIQVSRSFVTDTKAAEYTPIQYGDILFAGSGETIEDIGKSATNVMNSPACCGGDVILFRPHIEVDARFSGYAIDCPQSQYQKSCMGRGITIMHIYSDELKRLSIALPPLPEQRAIVRYLDHVDDRIRRYVSAKEKLIALLEEERQAVIHRAVTRGLDPNVPLKPSGVEWLGDVPAHWEIRPLKRWVSTKITDGPHETPDFLDDGIPFMSAESMVGGRLDFSRRRGLISREQHELYCRKCRPQSNDIFMCKSGATTGKVAIVDTADEFSVWSPLALIRVDPQKVLARLLFAVLQASYVQQQVKDYWSYGTQPNLAMNAMERIAVVLPPIVEQREVLAYLGPATKKTSEAISRARRQTELLREYRTRIIADVVTGKLDVRETAANLPDETGQ